MRVISGRFKNRPILSTRADWLRPTSDRTRETIFALLGSRVAGMTILDLFAGTGAIGLEALSRGAREGTFVDHSLVAIGLVRRNLQSLGMEARCFRMSASAFIKIAARANEQYDIIFCDPPYGSEQIATIVEEIVKLHILRRGGLLVLETGSRDAVIRCENLAVLKQKIMGDTAITIYQQVAYEK